MTGPTPQQILALAQAVTVKNALLLDANGRRQQDAQGAPRFVSLQQAVASGHAFTVEPRQGVIALDVDVVDGALPAWREPARSFCAEQGCYLVEVTSGGIEGGRHLWVVLPVGWTNVEFAQVLRQAVPALATKELSKQVRHTQATRPPLSIHRSGSQPQLISPTTVEQALAVLTGPRPNQTAGLSEQVQHLLRHGVQTGRDVALFSIALGFVNAGRDFSDYERAVLSPANQAGQVVRDLTPIQQRPFLEKKWASACKQVRENPATSEHRRRQVEALQATAASFPFSGHHNTDRLVFQELVRLAGLSFLTEVTTTQRQLVEKTSRNRKAVQTALRRLQDQHGLIKLLEPGRGREASRYQLICKVDVTTPTSSHLGGRMFSHGGTSVAFGAEGLHPAFGGSRGLPAGAAVLWDRMDLEEDWYTVSELVTLVAGSKPATVRGQLDALQLAGLVDRNKPAGHRWRKLPGDDRLLDRVAEGNGNAERAQRHRDQHQLERQAYEHRGRVEQAPKVCCSGTTKAGTPCQSTALPTGPRTRAAHCRSHASEEDRMAWNAWRAQAHPEHLALAT